ncbi:MAG: hypothetical protein AAB601_03225 [Patescibacteria group bacterium]
METLNILTGAGIFYGMMLLVTLTYRITERVTAVTDIRIGSFHEVALEALYFWPIFLLMGLFSETQKKSTRWFVRCWVIIAWLGIGGIGTGILAGMQLSWEIFRFFLGGSLLWFIGDILFLIYGIVKGEETRDESD